MNGPVSALPQNLLVVGIDYQQDRIAAGADKGVQLVRAVEHYDVAHVADRLALPLAILALQALTAHAPMVAGLGRFIAVPAPPHALHAFTPVQLWSSSQSMNDC